MTKQIDIPLIVVDFSPEHFELVKTLSMVEEKIWSMYRLPCYDDDYAGKLLEEHNADFIITGEVLNKDRCRKTDKL